MSVLRAEALKELAIKPGEMRCVTVDDYEVEIRRPALVIDDPGPMVDIWLKVPPSPQARMIPVQRGAPILPSPIHIDESDLAPE